MSSELSATAVRSRAPGVRALPGLRTLASTRFRALVAVALVLIGAGVLGTVLIHQASDPAGQFGIDFGAYRRAADNLARGATPYASQLLQGPFDAQGLDHYLYPPPFAQLLVPIAALPWQVSVVGWLCCQAAAALAATWLASGAGGARRSVERALWCGVATVWFLPIFDSLWKGNVSTILALQVALALTGGFVGGVALAAAVLLKVAPIALVPAAAGSGRHVLASGAAVGLAIVAVSFAWSPSAWLDYARVLPNLLAGSAGEATNLAPWAVLERLGAPAAIGDLVRLASVLAAILMSLTGFALARRPGGWRAAIALGTLAMLLLPAALWYHYLAVLLPLAALAWPGASARTRIILAGAGAAVSLGVAWLPLATVGASVLGVATIVVLWPRAVAGAQAPQGAIGATA